MPHAASAGPMRRSPRLTWRWPRPASRPGTEPGCWCWPRGRTPTSGRSRRPAGWPTTALEEAIRDGRQLGHGLGAARAEICTGMQGQMTDALPLFDRALAVTQADPALTDLRMLLQINKAITLGNLDRYDEALAAARQALALADYVGTVVRLAQAHGALGQLLFDIGRWDEAMIEVASLDEDLKEPAATCCDLRHRRRHLLPPRRDSTTPARIWPRPTRTPSGSATGSSARLRWRAAWIESTPMSRPRRSPSSPPGSRHDRRASTRSRTCSPMPSGSPLETEDLATAKTLAGHARRWPPGQRSRIGRRTRSIAVACLSRIRPVLLAAAERYEKAGRPLRPREGA